MKDVLVKFNMVKNHNQIISLKHKNKENTDKTQELVDSYKKIVSDYEDKMKSEVNNMNKKIAEIQEENSNLKMQCDFYKNCLNKIPNFILWIFVGKNKKLLNKWEKIWKYLKARKKKEKI